jgi:hypothetical protein
MQACLFIAAARFSVRRMSNREDCGAPKSLRSYSSFGQPLGAPLGGDIEALVHRLLVPRSLKWRDGADMAGKSASPDFPPLQAERAAMKRIRTEALLCHVFLLVSVRRSAYLRASTFGRAVSPSLILGARSDLPKHRRTDFGFHLRCGPRFNCIDCQRKDDP